MVGFTFKKSFVGPITAREKQQTIRRPRKHRPRVGQPLSFFTGSRLKPARLGSATIVAVRDVRLDFENDTVTLDDAEVIAEPEALDAFAVRDGFNAWEHEVMRRHGIGPWAYLKRWWQLTHPDQPVFLGVLVDWGDTFSPPSPDVPAKGAAQ